VDPGASCHWMCGSHGLGLLRKHVDIRMMPWRRIGRVRSGRVVAEGNRSVVITPAPVVGFEPSGRIVVLRKLPRLIVGVVTPLLVFLMASVVVVPDDWNRTGVFPRVCGGTGSVQPGGLLSFSEVVRVESFGKQQARSVRLSRWGRAMEVFPETIFLARSLSAFFDLRGGSTTTSSASSTVSSLASIFVEKDEY
jgi:hypothetical protein